LNFEKNVAKYRRFLQKNSSVGGKFVCFFAKKDSESINRVKNALFASCKK